MKHHTHFSDTVSFRNAYKLQQHHKKNCPRRFNFARFMNINNINVEQIVTDIDQIKTIVKHSFRLRRINTHFIFFIKICNSYSSFTLNATHQFSMQQTISNCICFVVTEGFNKCCNSFFIAPIHLATIPTNSSNAIRQAHTKFIKSWKIVVEHCRLCR